MGSYCSSCWKHICCCCRSKEDEENERLREMYAELYYPPEKKLRPSSPSTMPTDSITAVFESQNVENDNKIIVYRGYKILEEVGKGGSGVVYKAVKTSDRTIIACKRVDIKLGVEKADKNRSDAKNELFIIQMTKHPNIVRVYDHFMIKRPKTQSVYIIMEFVGNTLAQVLRNPDIIRTLNEPIFQRMFAQTVSAVLHMHRKGIAHRDIKMGNILIDDSLNVLVTDFGLSVVAYRVSKGGIILSQTYTGTPQYMAPEIVRCSKDNRYPYDPFKADIWALGVILCCMINRTFPFDHRIKDVFVRLNQMKHKKFPITSRHTPANLSDHCFDIQKKLLEFDVKKRITTDQLAKHPWISDQINLIEKQISKQ